MHRDFLVFVVTLSVGLAACNRDPVPSTTLESCVSMCEAVACINPDLDEDALEDCESYCHAKFEASREQGSGCEAAFERGMQCLAALSCSEYESWILAEATAPCPDAREDVETACEGIYLEAQILPP